MYVTKFGYFGCVHGGKVSVSTAATVSVWLVPCLVQCSVTVEHYPVYMLHYSYVYTDMDDNYFNYYQCFLYSTVSHIIFHSHLILVGGKAEYRHRSVRPILTSICLDLQKGVGVQMIRQSKVPSC